MRKFLFVFVFVLSVLIMAAGSVFAQASDVQDGGVLTQAGFIESLLQKDSVTWQDIAVLGSLSFPPDLQTEDFDGAGAFDYFKESGIIRDKFVPGSVVTEKEFSGFLVRLFDIKGSLWYSVFKTDGYAFRLLKYRGVVSSGDYGGDLMSGRKALLLFTRASGEVE